MWHYVNVHILLEMFVTKKKGLAAGSLGTVESAVIGIAGAAPAFSIAVTTATIVAAVGTLAVGSVLYCGLIMFGIMLAFVHLNKITQNAGACYAWVGQIFGSKWGFFTGWGLLVASITFMVSATIPAATSTLVLIAPELVENTAWVTGVAALWLSIISLIVTKGIKHASYAQLIFTFLESIIILALIIGAFKQYSSHPAHAPSWKWLSPFAFTPALFTTGSLSAIFFYWGWDVTMNLGEETQRRNPPPESRGAFWAMINLILFFIIMLIVVLIVLSDEEIASANTNVLYAIANKLFSPPWNYLAVLSTILSTIGTIETQILQFSRLMFAMARDNMMHPRYAIIHPKWQTPWLATFAIWFLGLILLFSSSYMPTVSAILQSSILAIGIQICFYMSITAFACCWHYRQKLKSSPTDALSYVLWPGLSATFMVTIAVYSIFTFDLLTNLIGIGGLAIGIIPFGLAQLRTNP